MDVFVIKRSGEYKPFQAFKIEDAILKSFDSVHVAYDEDIFTLVIDKLQGKTVWAVEEIQDLIEETLFKKEYFEMRLKVR